MDIAGVEKALVGMALFDVWEAALEKTNSSQKTIGSPLLAAVDQAFQNYVLTAQIGMAGQIAGAAFYALNPGGQAVSPVTNQEIAPFLALNLLA